MKTITREEMYATNFTVRRNDKTNRFWIHWAPFGYIFGTIQGPYKTYEAAFQAGVDCVHDPDF